MDPFTLTIIAAIVGAIVAFALSLVAWSIKKRIDMLARNYETLTSDVGNIKIVVYQLKGKMDMMT